MTLARAISLRLPGNQIRIGDLPGMGGLTMAVALAEHRGDRVRLELDTDTRLLPKPTTRLTISRPRTQPPPAPFRATHPTDPPLPGRPCGSPFSVMAPAGAVHHTDCGA